MRASLVSVGFDRSAYRFGARGVAASLLWCGLAVAGMSVAAQVKVPVPFTDVPMTLQSLAMVLIGLMLPARQAAMAMVGYVAFGVLGLPVFAPVSLGLLGPTGGYLIGFIVGVYCVAVVRQESRGFWRLLVAGATGLTALFLCGLVWRMHLLGGNLGAAISTGLLPFLPKAGVQLLFAVTFTRLVRRCPSGA